MKEQRTNSEAARRRERQRVAVGSEGDVGALDQRHRVVETIEALDHLTRRDDGAEDGIVGHDVGTAGDAGRAGAGRVELVRGRRERLARGQRVEDAAIIGADPDLQPARLAGEDVRAASKSA